MAFFTSEYECKLDTKGRLALPAKVKVNFPEVSANEIVLRKGFEPSIILYPMVEYKKIHHKISSLSEFDPEERRLKRHFFRSITLIELDAAKRILIPRAMQAHAQIQKEVLLIGMGNYVELWHPDLFAQYTVRNIEEYSDLAKKILDS